MKAIREERLAELRQAQIEQNTAYIEYIAMMADVTLPMEEADEYDMVRENQEMVRPESVE